MKNIKKSNGFRVMALAATMALTAATIPAPAQADPTGIATILGGAALLGLLVHSSQPLPVAYEPVPYPVVVPQQAQMPQPAIIYSSSTPAYVQQPQSQVSYQQQSQYGAQQPGYGQQASGVNYYNQQPAAQGYAMPASYPVGATVSPYAYAQ